MASLCNSKLLLLCMVGLSDLMTSVTAQKRFSDEGEEVDPKLAMNRAQTNEAHIERVAVRSK